MASDKYTENEEDNPMKHMGHGQFANMPKGEIFKEYPKQPQNYGCYDDTMKGIDYAETESFKKRDRFYSKQK